MLLKLAIPSWRGSLFSSVISSFPIKWSLPWVLICTEQLLISSFLRKQAETTGLTSSKQEDHEAGVAHGNSSWLMCGWGSWPKHAHVSMLSCIKFKEAWYLLIIGKQLSFYYIHKWKTHLETWSKDRSDYVTITFSSVNRSFVWLALKCHKDHQVKYAYFHLLFVRILISD